MALPLLSVGLKQEKSLDISATWACCPGICDVLTGVQSASVVPVWWVAWGAGFPFSSSLEWALVAVRAPVGPVLSSMFGG